MKFIKIFFGGPFGDFSDIKFFLVKTQQPLLIPIFFTTTYLLHSFKWPSIYKVTCPIDKGTLNSLVWWSMNYISAFELSEYKKEYFVFFIADQLKGFKVEPGGA